MACIQTRNYSYFGPLYPCPIFVRGTTCSENSVINPENVLNQSFFGLTNSTIIATDGAVPLTLISSSGNGFLINNGVVTLGVGRFQITYNVTSELSTSGQNIFGLTLNDENISSSLSTQTGTAGNRISQSNTVIVTTTSSSTISLRNLSTGNVQLINTNLLITKLN